MSEFANANWAITDWNGLGIFEASGMPSKPRVFCTSCRVELKRTRFLE